MTKDQNSRDGVGGQNRPGQDDKRRGDDSTDDSEQEIGSGHKQSRSQAPNAQGVQPEIGGRSGQGQSQSRQTGKGGQFSDADEMDSEQDELGKGSDQKRR